MRKHNLVKILLLFVVLAGVASSDANWAQNFYKEVPQIKIEEPFGVVTGSLNPDDPYLTISILDVALYAGHICPGIASGWKITELALKTLYDNDTPVRGMIKIAANVPSDLLDVASYVTGARAFYGRDEVNHNDIVIDTALGPHKPGVVVMIFKRKDNEKMVKVTFRKQKLFKDRKEMKRLKELKEKVLGGTASKRELETFKTILQRKAKEVLFDTPKGLISVEEIKNYKFPKN